MSRRRPDPTELLELVDLALEGLEPEDSDLPTLAGQLAEVWAARARLPLFVRTEVEAAVLAGVWCMPPARQRTVLEALQAALEANPVAEACPPTLERAWRLWTGQGATA